ncbi:peptide/nickel transport system permease protein [Pseudarthrobacter siccitolerans]|uniref:Peptide/nickel transport system permease protein n=1 Tax=Pseudarthrobacter siccitolerans TaxID=861266 RepID=A0ABU0PPC3_9MICC|nr:dipeptide/oligopeptide/nickel ABC transporter permease/ATP-binding protein [Pseudarthrobacter siccitolerans]MDQ0675094.1 peptide/nickel transport system permease protein [Pseudarthrobacter siccitolerans]MDQ0733371.1 peptide/nickel transport system permease protein [Arthrobacter sp. B1I2]
MSTEVALLETDVTEAASHRSPFRRLVRDPQAIITAAFLFIVLTLGLLAPFITQHGPNDSSLNAVNADIGTPGYLLGGDQSGRDIFSRLVHSINTGTISALIGTSMACLVGLTFGLVGGYFGGRIRTAIEWVFNLIMTFPGLLLLIVLMPLTKGDFRATMLIFGALLAPSIYRIVRNVTAGVKNELYVDAARVAGLSTLRILGRHVMPVVRGPVIISAAFLMGSSINLQSGLAFLGVGSTEVPSFGSMISAGFLNFYVHPTQFLWPALLLGAITASLVLLGNSLRDALEGARPKAAKLDSARVRSRGVDLSEGNSDESNLLHIKDLQMEYPTPNGKPKQVLKGVSLKLKAGETLGLVGESGSGKTQTAFSALGVLPPEGVITAGSVLLDGRELLGLRERELREIRGKDIAYIPQEPMSNLDPSFTVGAQLVEGIRVASGMTRAEAKKRALELMERVGIPNSQRTFGLYPHQISGGMAQRVLIAGAVACKPRLLIADEPTTALDVTIQAEILDLLRDLQQEMGMAILLVTHNFGVVADICDRIAVMREGLIVEEGDVMQVFHHPNHPYTQKLLNSILDESHLREDLTSLVTTSKEQK